MLIEVGNVIAKPLSVFFEGPQCSGEVFEDWKKANVIPVSRSVRRRIWRCTDLSASPESLAIR